MGSSCCGSGSSEKPAESCCATEVTEASEGSEGSPVKLTDSAVKAIKEAIKEEGEAGDNLRVSVVGGGCSGLQYNLDFDKESRMGDVVINCDGVSVFIDSVSAGYLKGTTIDYVSGLNGTGFKFENPNAKRTCGCGSSFS